MSKLRSDSKLGGLNAAQSETLEGWLFEENLGYTAIKNRLKSEFGVETSRSAVGRYCAQLARSRNVTALKEATDEARKLDVTDDKWEDTEDTLLKLITRKAMQLVLEQPDNLKGLAALARVVVQGKEARVRQGFLKNDITRVEERVAERRRKMEKEEQERKEALESAERSRVAREKFMASKEMQEFMQGWAELDDDEDDPVAEEAEAEPSTKPVSNNPEEDGRPGESTGAVPPNPGLSNLRHPICTGEEGAGTMGQSENGNACG